MILWFGGWMENEREGEQKPARDERTGSIHTDPFI